MIFATCKAFTRFTITAETTDVFYSQIVEVLRLENLSTYAALVVRYFVLFLVTDGRNTPCV